MVQNTFLDALVYLTERLNVFRREQGYLYNPEDPAASDIVSLETEALISLYLGHQSDVCERLACAYKKAVAHHLIDTEQLANAYARLLPTLKVPITNLIWAEDDAAYNLGLEAYLIDHDYSMMASLLVQAFMEKLVTQMQGLPEKSAGMGASF